MLMPSRNHHIIRPARLRQTTLPEKALKGRHYVFLVGLAATMAASNSSGKRWAYQ
jgi:hypothetical protein